MELTGSASSRIVTGLWDSLISNSVPPGTPISSPHPQDPSELPGDANTFTGQQGEEDVQ